MPVATVNNKALNPTPYQPHINLNNYNFHSSLYKYHVVGTRGDRVIVTGDKILLYWVIYGSSGEDAYRYIRCTIPKPGT